MACLPRPARPACLATALLALAGHAPVRAADVTPQPAPALFVTQANGLAIDLPPGLTYCPLPANWTGTDHGTEVYLQPPDRCGDPRAYSSSRRLPASFVPAVTIFYNLNVAYLHRAGGPDSPPVTDAELADQICGEDHAPLPRGVELLGRAASGCLSIDDGVADIQATSVYSAGGAPGGRPDHILIVTLETAADRIRSGFAIFRRIAAGIRICRSPQGAADPKLEPCPQGANWW